MMELLNGVFSFGYDVFTLMITVILALSAGASASLKGRSGWLWGGITLFFPLAAFIVFFLPRKVPKFRSYLKDDPAFIDKNPVVASIMALSAIVAKADGQVTKDEVNLIRQFITSNFRMNKHELANYQSAFDYGKNHPDEYGEFVRIIKTYYNDRRFILSISYLLLGIGLNDNNLGSNEETIIKKIVVELGISEYEYQSLKNYFTNGGFSGASYAGYGSYSSGYGNGAYGNGGYGGTRGFGTMNQAAQVEKYAKVLGVSKDASMSEIKKAYRKLAKEYHPDKMAAEGMPKDYEKYATERIAEINEAYDFMKKYKEESNETSTQYV